MDYGSTKVHVIQWAQYVIQMILLNVEILLIFQVFALQLQILAQNFCKQWYLLLQQVLMNINGLQDSS